MIIKLQKVAIINKKMKTTINNVFHKSNNFHTFILFLRSLISSLSILLTNLPNFFHPYIKKSLLLLLPLYNIKQTKNIQQQQLQVKTIKSDENIDDEQVLLADTIDVFLFKIVECMPPRLLIPSIVESTASILNICNVFTIVKYVSLFENVCNNLERSLIMSNLQDLSMLATCFLDYRRVHGGQNEDQNNVDATIANAIVSFCLKLT
jgi:hypothetical protein